MLNREDKALLIKKGITEKQMEEQLGYFKNGFPFLNLISSASTQKGIMKADKTDKWIEKWEEYCKLDKKILKFVPASGAASRMFKALFAFLEADYEKPVKETEKKFFENIKHFAFYNSLNEKCKENDNKSIDELLKEGKYKIILDNLLNENGLNYGNHPKGVLLFHRYADSVRTPVEEHMTEGSMYARCKNTVYLHFTVSPEHRPLFEKLIKEKQNIYENRLEVKYNIGFSEQKPKTDTVAVDMENKFFRENGQLVFRPGGHGALIENLNDIQADIIFIKNIDNVVLDNYKGEDVKYKKTLAGILINVQHKIFEYLELLDPKNIHYRIYPKW